MAQRKTIVVSASIIVFLFLASFIFFLLIRPRIAEKPKLKETIEDVLKSLTAPAGQATEVPKEVLDSLTAPKRKSAPVPEDVLKSLTAPAK